MLLTTQNAKTSKGEPLGYLTGILYLAPHTITAGKSLCPSSTASCRAGCLYSAGRGRFTSVQEARIRKTQRFRADPRQFLLDVVDDVETLSRRAAKQGLRLAIRLNGTSDVDWRAIDGEAWDRIASRATVYDYTKRLDLTRGPHLTYSVAASTPAWLARATRAWGRGLNLAIVVRRDDKAGLLSSGLPFVDGDAHDLRFLDPPRSIVLLASKGELRKHPGNFVFTTPQVEALSLSLQSAKVAA